MRASDALAWAIDQLDGTIPDPVALDARWLIESIVDPDASGRFQPAAPLTENQWSDYQAAVNRRARGEPLAYVLGAWEFFGLDFEVNASVLVPRPETEHLVEWALELLPQEPLPSHGGPRGLEIGVGSGCVVTTIAKERPHTRWVATDISEEALAVARRNGDRHRVNSRVEWILHDLADLEEASAWRGDGFDLIVSNPPYIAPDDPELAANVAQFEPHTALLDVWDQDGLGAYRRLAALARDTLRPDGWVLVEVGNTQAREVAAIFEGLGLGSEIRRDLAGIERMVGAH